MTSKLVALRVLDAVFVAFTTVLILWVGGLPIDWLSGIVDMAPVEFHWFSMFVVFAALLLMHAIANAE
ncbi:hypothetical protein [Bradyrhizobium sp. NP1]|jgi:hypothetical protein|uniref:hypothetical protein n=1 Tax=Bradyrhizobium sp. NP1 TaxID=3049772 RepID=UPI0025A554CE|nr:hypothetical protein [Bradyrhizobium sp. NP1]WJR78230.1 hypothetical protein QOU61_37030 [Bradyrhizobium sp. NP1]